LQAIFVYEGEKEKGLCPFSRKQKLQAIFVYEGPMVMAERKGEGNISLRLHPFFLPPIVSLFAQRS